MVQRMRIIIPFAALALAMFLTGASNDCQAHGECMSYRCIYDGECGLGVCFCAISGDNVQGVCVRVNPSN